MAQEGIKRDPRRPQTIDESIVFNFASDPDAPSPHDPRSLWGGVEAPSDISVPAWQGPRALRVPPPGKYGEGWIGPPEPFGYEHGVHQPHAREEQEFVPRTYRVGNMELGYLDALAMMPGAGVVGAAAILPFAKMLPTKTLAKMWQWAATSRPGRAVAEHLEDFSKAILKETEAGYELRSPKEMMPGVLHGSKYAEAEAAKETAKIAKREETFAEWMARRDPDEGLDVGLHIPETPRKGMEWFGEGAPVAPGMQKVAKPKRLKQRKGESIGDFSRRQAASREKMAQVEHGPAQAPLPARSYSSVHNVETPLDEALSGRPLPRDYGQGVDEFVGERIYPDIADPSENVLFHGTPYVRKITERNRLLEPSIYERPVERAFGVEGGRIGPPLAGARYEGRGLGESMSPTDVTLRRGVYEGVEVPGAPRPRYEGVEARRPSPDPIDMPRRSLYEGVEIPEGPRPIYEGVGIKKPSPRPLDDEQAKELAAAKAREADVNLKVERAKEQFPEDLVTKTSYQEPELRYAGGKSPKVKAEEKKIEEYFDEAPKQRKSISIYEEGAERKIDEAQKMLKSKLTGTKSPLTQKQIIALNKKLDLLESEGRTLSRKDLANLWDQREWEKANRPKKAADLRRKTLKEEEKIKAAAWKKKARKKSSPKEVALAAEIKESQRLKKTPKKKKAKQVISKEEYEPKQMQEITEDIHTSEGPVMSSGEAFIGQTPLGTHKDSAFNIRASKTNDELTKQEAKFLIDNDDWLEKKFQSLRPSYRRLDNRAKMNKKDREFVKNHLESFYNPIKKTPKKKAKQVISKKEHEEALALEAKKHELETRGSELSTKDRLRLRELQARKKTRDLEKILSEKEYQAIKSKPFHEITKEEELLLSRYRKRKKK